MAEKQSKHRQDLEKHVVLGAEKRASLGLALGFIITVAFLAASVTLIVMGYRVEGTVLGTVDLVSLATIFVIGRREQRAEREDKRPK